MIGTLWLIRVRVLSTSPVCVLAKRARTRAHLVGGAVGLSPRVHHERIVHAAAAASAQPSQIAGCRTASSLLF